MAISDTRSQAHTDARHRWAEKCEVWIEHKADELAAVDTSVTWSQLSEARRDSYRAMARKALGLVEPDSTEALVAEFSAALLAKLRAAEVKYGYRDGWLIEDWEIECRAQLLKHIQKGDPIDVAAYCAFMWKRGWKTDHQDHTDHAPKEAWTDGL